MADALLIASIGGEALWRRAQQAYMQRAPAPYMQVVQAVLEGNLAGTYVHKNVYGVRACMLEQCTNMDTMTLTNMCHPQR